MPVRAPWVLWGVGAGHQLKGELEWGSLFMVMRKALLDSHIVPLYPTCHVPWKAKKPLPCLCALSPSPAVGGWGCTLCMSADLLSWCWANNVRGAPPAFAAPSASVRVCPASTASSCSPWNGHLPGGVEGHTVRAQKSL